MSVERVFLGWDRPFVPTAAQYFAERYAGDERIDMRNVAVVVLGSRAGRRLLELLVAEADLRERVLIPPQIVSAGSLDEIIIEGGKPIVSDLHRITLWTEALRSCRAADISAVLPSPPDREDRLAWMALAQHVDTLYAELSGGELDFAKVAKASRRFPAGFVDEDRWQELDKVFQCYKALLDETGASDVHLERLAAVTEGRVRFGGEVYLLATADLNQITRKLLTALDAPVRSLVFAPDSHAALFDEFGCIIPAKWREQSIDLADEHFSVMASLQDEAESLAERMAALASQYGAQDIIVGVGNRGAVPFIAQELQSRGVTARDVDGQPLHTAAPLLLLQAIATYLTTRSFGELATIVRHLDLQTYLVRTLKEEGKPLPLDFAVAFDRYQSRHLQATVGDTLPGAGSFIAPLVDEIERLLKPFKRKPRNLTEWAEPIGTLIETIYRKVDLTASNVNDHRTLEACAQIRSVVSELSRLPVRYVPEVSAADALRLVVRELSTASLQPLSGTDAVELIGWLELPLDDAPVLFVTDFNEGRIPESVNADSFLPNSFRAHLGLIDNDRRYARDLYSLTTILHSKRVVHLFTSTIDERGEPQVPSRLLLACEDRELVHRVQRFYTELEPVRRRTPGQALVGTEVFAPKKPEPLAGPISEMSVSAFRTYLACPYRFYLKHVRRLERLNDRAVEMDPLSFGTLAHEVLVDFGRSGLSASTDVEAIRKYLRSAVDRFFNERFGRTALPALLVQRFQLEQRLRAFAEWQARWAGLGWEIKHTELEFGNTELSLRLDDGPMGVSGRIDRIDFNRRDGSWCIFDYKTGDRVEAPDKTHRKRKEWCDLQLPIYRRAVEAFDVRGAVSLGYIPLPGNVKRIQELIADWSADDLEDANQCMERVAQRVRAQQFWPPRDLGSSFDEYEVLCEGYVPESAEQEVA